MSVALSQAQVVSALAINLSQKARTAATEMRVKLNELVSEFDKLHPDILRQMPSDELLELVRRLHQASSSTSILSHGESWNCQRKLDELIELCCSAKR